MLSLLLAFAPAGFAAEPEKAAATQAEEDAQFTAFLAKFNWTKGPAEGTLGEVGGIKVPEGFMLAGPADTKQLMKAFGNIVSDQEIGLLAPHSLDWFIVFEFDAVGYVKDDEKDDLDSAKMLDSIKRGTEHANEQRASSGAAPLNIIGWELEPRFNDETKLLEWSIRAESDGHQILNHNTRILGRSGVMEVALVVSPEVIKETLPIFYSLLDSFSFKEGQKYAEYQEGDPIAKYGLAALIVGGAAVGAAKLGLFAWLALTFKKLWKLIVVAFVAVIAWIRKLVTGDSAPEPDPEQES